MRFSYIHSLSPTTPCEERLSLRYTIASRKLGGIKLSVRKSPFDHGNSAAIATRHSTRNVAETDADDQNKRAYGRTDNLGLEGRRIRLCMLMLNVSGIFRKLR